MNCEPKDRAWVVKIYKPYQEEYLGKIVTVLRVLRIDPTYGPIWEIEEPFLVSCTDERKVFCIGIADCCLKPIRDPGDDAKDEMLRPLPKPVEVLT